MSDTSFDGPRITPAAARASVRTDPQSRPARPRRPFRSIPSQKSSSCMEATTTRYASWAFTHHRDRALLLQQHGDFHDPLVEFLEVPDVAFRVRTTVRSNSRDSTSSVSISPGSPAILRCNS